MITPDYLRAMSLYNRWQNEQLYGLCQTLDDAERKRDRGMFFRSIHRTLHHILYIDRVIVELVHSGRRPVLDFDDLPYDDFATLLAERQQMDARLQELASEHAASWLLEKANPAWPFVRGFQLVQMFNHQTHHRSQVTSELHKLGLDYGCTDMPYNPYELAQV